MGFWKERQIMEWERGFSAPPGYYVCADCIHEPTLKELVAQEVSAEHCDFCDREAREPVAADTDVVLTRIAESLCTEYEAPEEELIWDNEEHRYIGASVYDIDEVLEDVTELPLGHARFDEFVLAAFRESQWCARDPFGVSETGAWRYGWADLRETVKHHQRFFFVIQAQDDPDDDPGATIPRGGKLLEELGCLIRDHHLVTDLATRSVLYRVRPHEADDFPETAKELGAPPANVASQSRMSPAGIPMFYAADEPETAIAETLDAEDKPRDTLTIARFETTEACRIVDLSLLPDAPSIFDDRTESRALRPPLLFLNGFRRDISAHVKRDDRIHIEYVPTQVVSEYLRHLFRDADGQPISGLAWESARRPGARNVVLFLDRDRCVEPGEQPDLTQDLLVELMGHERRTLR